MNLNDPDTSKFVIQSAPEWKLQGVEGGTILDRIYTFVRRFVSLSDPQARVVCLWVVHTYAFAAADATPYLAITSAEKESGKTRLLEVLEILVANPWFTGRVTPAVLTRKIDAQAPTLLLDESDAAFGGDKEYAEVLRGVLNTGHRKGGKASCCVGQGANTTFRDFSTFCPKAIAGIGHLPDTVAGRAIPIRLKRAAPGEGIARFRRREVDADARSLQTEIQAWSVSISDSLLTSRAELPSALTDRQQDGVEPLLAISEAAGTEWAERARLAVVQLCSEMRSTDESIGRQLLTDIRQILESRSVDRLASVDLASELAGIETSPWGEWAKERPLTPSGLARLLKPFDISPESIRVGDQTPKGYLREQFQDAFRRYVRPQGSNSTPQSATPQQASSTAVVRGISECNSDGDVAGSIWPKHSVCQPCCGVALSKPPGKEVERGIEEDL